MGKKRKALAVREYRTADGDHSVLPPPTAGTLTDDSWTAVWPELGVALDRAGMLQSSWYGGTRSVLSIPAAWAAVTILCRAAAVMNVGAFKGLRPLPQPSVLAEPAPGEARATTVAAWVRDLLIHGNAFGVLADRDGRGYVPSIVPVPAENVAVSRVNGRVVYYVGSSPQEPMNVRLQLDREEVFHAKGYAAPGSLRGYGVLEYHARTIDTAHAEDAYAKDAFLNSGIPTALIHSTVPLNREKAAELKRQWMDQFQNRREPAVLSGPIEFTPLAWNPSDMQIVSLRELSDRDMARLFGVPAYWIDALASGSSLTYQNIQDASQGFLRFSLAFWVTLLEVEFSRCLPRGSDARFNRDSLLRAGQKERFETHAIGLSSGFMLVDEVRADESMMPLDDAEEIVAGGPAATEPTSPLPGPAADQVSNAQVQP